MKILLGTLKDKGEELATFLEPRTGGKPKASGSEITIEDSSLREGLRSRHVKTYVKRFLRKEKVRRDYRVLVEGGELKLIEIEETEEEKERRQEEEKKAKEKGEEPKETGEEGEKGAEEEEEKAAEPKEGPSAAAEQKKEKKPRASKKKKEQGKEET